MFRKPRAGSDSSERSPEVLPARQHEQGDDLRRWQPGVDDDVLDGGRLIEELLDVVRRVDVPAPEPVALDPHLAAPALDVDDEHSTRADDQDVDVRRPGARPAPVGQDVPAHVVHADQHPDHPVLGPAAGPPRAFLATQFRQQVRQATDVPLDDLDLQADQRCLGEGGRRGLVRCGGVVLTGHSRPLTCAATD